MIGRGALGEYVDGMLAAVCWEGWDGFEATMARATPEEVRDAVDRLVPVVAKRAQWRGYGLAQALAAMVDFGAEPGDVLPTLVERAARAMERAAEFERRHRAAFGEPPDTLDGEQYQVVMERMRGELDERAAVRLVNAWYIGDEWVQPVLYLGQRADVRATLPQRERLRAAVEQAPAHFGNAFWLAGLLAVLDDEPFVVLDRGYAGTGRGFRLTIGGVGDNFQLHTLLAAALVGAGLPGRRPAAAEIDAATGGEQVPVDPIRGLWDMVRADGRYVSNEGRPADFSVVDGARVVVLDGAEVDRRWRAGRAYAGMAPSVRLDGVMAAGEAAAWLGRCAGRTRTRRLT